MFEKKDKLDWENYTIKLTLKMIKSEKQIERRNVGMEEVYKKQQEIEDKIDELRDERKKYDQIIEYHFKKMLKRKHTEKELFDEYVKIPESNVKYKVYKLIVKSGYFSY